MYELESYKYETTLGGKPGTATAARSSKLEKEHERLTMAARGFTRVLHNVNSKTSAYWFEKDTSIDRQAAQDALQSFILANPYR